VKILYPYKIITTKISTIFLKITRYNFIYIYGNPVFIKLDVNESIVSLYLPRIMFTAKKRRKCFKMNVEIAKS